MLKSLLDGPAFTYTILSLYALQCVRYSAGGHWGRAMYWLSAALITISAEFVTKRFP